MTRAMQGLAVAVAVILWPYFVWSVEPTACARLIQECDALLRTAVQRPYAWGWVGGAEQSSPIRGTAVVSMGPMGTPAAGLVLVWAGQALNDQKYLDGARQAGRAVLAAQRSNGRIPGSALFGSSVRWGESEAASLDRSATVSCLGLLLALVEQGGADTEAMRRGAMRAAQWLAEQQMAGGGWPTTVQAEDGLQKRLIRLDEPDLRNTLLALVYASRALESEGLRGPAHRGVRHVMGLRIQQSKTASGLWQAVYELSGMASDALPERAKRVDLVACRNAMQVLLAASIVAGDPAVSEVLAQSAQSVARIRYSDGLWRRFYALEGSEVLAPGTGASPRPEEPFASRVRSPHEELHAVGDFWMGAVLVAEARLREEGVERVRALLSARQAPERDIASVLVGLSDEPFSLNWPANRVEAQAWLSSSAERWPILGGRAGGELATRVRRIEALLERMRVEKMAAEGR